MSCMESTLIWAEDTRRLSESLAWLTKNVRANVLERNTIDIRRHVGCACDNFKVCEHVTVLACYFEGIQRYLETPESLLERLLSVTSTRLQDMDDVLTVWGREKDKKIHKRVKNLLHLLHKKN